ncbi:hypothetical protein [Dietzia sp.]|uniref:hypothetical protein n=1 Tax=Dietzia sp. TaxID=1871616 RepID=UPI002FD99D42
MPDFGALSDLFSNVADAFGVVSGFGGSLADPFGDLDGDAKGEGANALFTGSLEALGLGE